MNDVNENLNAWLSTSKPIKRTRHKWAEIYGNGRYYAYKHDNGLFQQICITGNSHFFTGKEYKTPEECIFAAHESMKTFIADKVVFI